MNLFKVIVIFIVFASVFTSCNYIEDVAVADSIIYEEINVVNNNVETSDIIENVDLTRISMGIPMTLNPLLNTDLTVSNVLDLMFMKVTELDENFMPIPSLAEDIIFTTEDDALSCTIFIDNNATWHDLTPVTAEDFIYSYQTLDNASDNVIYKDNISAITSVKKVNSKTVVVNFSCSYQEALYSLSFPLIPAHYYNSSNDKSLVPLGNGEYRFVSYSLADKMTLTRVNDENSNNVYGKVLGNNVEVLIVPNKDAGLSALKKGIIDMDISTISEWGAYGDTELNIEKTTSSYYDFIGFNYNNKIFDSRDIRYAIYSLINFDEVMNNIYLGYMTPCETPINQNSWLYNSEVTKYSYDYNKSLSLFTAYGFSDFDNDGYLEAEVGSKKVEGFTILVNEENAERVEIATLIANSLNDLNIYCEISSLPFEEYVLAIENKDFDIIVGGYSLSYDGNLEFLLGSGENIFSYSNDIMDNYLEKVANSDNNSELLVHMALLQQYISDELPIISICFRDDIVVSRW